MLHRLAVAAALTVAAIIGSAHPAAGIDDGAPPTTTTADKTRPVASTGLEIVYGEALPPEQTERLATFHDLGSTDDTVILDRFGINEFPTFQYGTVAGFRDYVSLDLNISPPHMYRSVTVVSMLTAADPDTLVTTMHEALTSRDPESWDVTTGTITQDDVDALTLTLRSRDHSDDVPSWIVVVSTYPDRPGYTGISIERTTSNDVPDTPTVPPGITDAVAPAIDAVTGAGGTIDGWTVYAGIGGDWNLSGNPAQSFGFNAEFPGTDITTVASALCEAAGLPAPDNDPRSTSCRAEDWVSDWSLNVMDTSSYRDPYTAASYHLTTL